MKKYAVLLALLMLVCLCALPCGAEENDGTIVMEEETFFVTSSPVPPVDPDAPDGSVEDSDIGEATTIPGTAADATLDEKDSLVTPIAPSAPTDTSAPTTGSVIGGADGPTAILVAESDGISFHPENFIHSLSYMGTGMIGIFIVIGLIVLATVVLNKMFSDKSKKDE